MHGKDAIFACNDSRNRMKTGLESGIWTVGLRLKTHDLSDVLKVGALLVATAGCCLRPGYRLKMESIDGGLDCWGHVLIPD